jgi:hypothetical protein
MTFLPIVERELRVASRRQFTYWFRLVAAAFALLIFGAMLSISMFTPGMPWSAGQIQFSVLKWLAFVFACSAGVFLTSDALSEEKREGTLGLLFLTDLRGFDVVLGKLMSHSLQAFYGLVAALPILALPLLIGGVSGSQFGQALLVICNTLFLSLAIGMFVSSISREVMKAMNAAVLISLLFLIGLPWVDLGLAGWESVKFKCIVSVASPGYLFSHEDSLRPGDFWFQLGLQHLLGWIFLALACLCIPHAWQERSTTVKGPRQSLARWWRYGGQRARLALRRKLLDKNPVLWLALRDRWMNRLVWTVLIVAFGSILWNLYLYWDSSQFNNTGNSLHALLVLALVLWIGSQACRLFVDAMRNGAMELILVTPITPEQIVRGQWKALLRTFLIPALLVLGLNIANQIETIRIFAKSMASTPGAVSNNFSWEAYQIVSLVSSILTLSGDLVAMAWFGMWMGMTSRKTSIAVLKTICFVCVLPWIASIFVQIAGMGLLARAGKWPFWLSSVISSIFELAKNVVFIVWARQRLLTRFREMAAQGGQQVARRQRMVLPAIPVPAAPPVIQ